MFCDRRIAAGVREGASVEALSGTGYAVAPRARRPWLHDLRSAGAALADGEQREIFAGRVLHRMDSRSPVPVHGHARAMILKRFGVELTEASAHSYLHGMGFALRGARSRPKDTTCPTLRSFLLRGRG